MRKNLFRTLSVFCSIIIILSVGSVFAVWTFSSDEAPPPVSDTLQLLLSEFTWDGSDMLPDDVEGEDHAWLIKNLVSGELNGEVIGLDNPNSDLNDYINDRLKGGWGWKRDYFGSMAVTGDAEMEALFGAKAQGLSFIIQVVSDTEYYIYTTSADLGERGEANWLGTGNKTPGKPNYALGTYIYPIYRTKLSRNSSSDKWNIIETKCGKAISAWYDENRSNANITQIPAFDPDTWVEATEA